MLLFKRVGGAFRGIEGRDWALLSLETLGVVAGILIAFELNEWAVRRNDAARHDKLMGRLFEEAESDVSTLRDWRDTLRAMLEREQAFAASVSSGQCPAASEFRAVQTLSMMPALTVPTSVYEELMGAGGLSSIERKDVRNSVAQFHNTLGWAQSQVDYFRALNVKPLAESDPRVRILFDPAVEDPEVAVFDAHALCRDHGFKNRVASATRQHTVFVSYFQAALEDAINMCVRLGNSLGRACMPQNGGPLTGGDATYAEKVVGKMRGEMAHHESAD